MSALLIAKNSEVYQLNKIRNKSLGDFQTPRTLTDRVCAYLKKSGVRPRILVEPTCGEGNFVLSALETFPELEYVYAIDRQKHYERTFEEKLLRFGKDEFFEKKFQGTIEFHCDDIFTHVFSPRFSSFLEDNSDGILILGNPPWATNSNLSAVDSHNLPTKSNLKRFRGFDALTGKSNFDISEYIILRMLDAFSKFAKNSQTKTLSNPTLAMLCKTSVIRNIVRDASSLGFKLSSFRQLAIDAKKEFEISADSALFMTQIHHAPRKQSVCRVASLEQPHHLLKKYGWYKRKFVADFDLYKKYDVFDGKSTFEWRQGVKHDSVKVMVLKYDLEGTPVNGFGHKVDIEDGLLYPFFKGSDLREPILMESRSRIIVTIKSIKSDTSYIRARYPKTWNYLEEHSSKLDARKSKIYSGMPRFSIFGVGDYSFKPYKVAICSMYREPRFALVMPIHNKPVMLDDISYFLSFDSVTDAIFTWLLLNSDEPRNMLSSVVFENAKRLFTKEVLMRINFSELVKRKTFAELTGLLKKLDPGDFLLKMRISEADYSKYKNSVENFTE